MIPQTTSENKFVYTNPLILSDLAKELKIDAGFIIKYFFIKGRITNMNTVLNKEDCKELCLEFNFLFEEGTNNFLKKDLFSKYLDFSSIEDDVVSKTPVVTIMGHVDHGKTTLLDKIRGSSITASEFGGITQHIGAYQIIRKNKDGNKKITFIDTPGHQAFTKMRFRGANVTDIVVLVVAADDGIKPQTIEAIQHALAAKVKIIVFINKIDKGVKKIDSLKNSLIEHNILLEEFGGDVMCVLGSALTGKGVDDLLDAILLLSELSEFKTSHKLPTVGAIIESKMEKGLGAIATVLLFRGTLKCGDLIITKSSTCKVKSITGTSGEEIKKLEPSVPAKISGFKEFPEAGDRFIFFNDSEKSDSFIKELGDYEKKREAVFIEKQKDVKELKVLIKADVSGSLEAIKEIINLNGIDVISASVGLVTEIDMQLASISGALIINFNQKISKTLVNRAKEMNLVINSYRSIYEIEEYISEIIEDNKIYEMVENVLGKAHVLKLWYHSKIGTIAGCKVVSGKISKTDKVRVIRNSEILVSSTIKSFKTESFEIKECLENQECGIVINKWDDIKEGDVIESFEVVRKND